LKTFRQIIQYDAELGHKYVPNQFTRLRYGNNGYFIETDPLGFRNSAYPACEKTIIILGDSFAAGDGVENSKRFSDLLAKQFNCTFVNLAVSGYGIDQQLLTYKKYKDQIPHDAVILAPHVDDLYRNLLSSREGIDKSKGEASLIPKPYFKLVNNSLKLCNSPVPREREVVSNVKPKHRSTFGSRAKNFLNRRILKHVLHPELSDPKSELWKLMHALLVELKNDVGEKNLFIIPFPYYDSVTYGETPNYLIEFEKHAAKNVTIIDIVNELNSEYKKDISKWFLPLCGHFTPDAHQLIANHLGVRLKNIFPPKESVRDDTPTESKDVFALGISCFYHDSAAAILKNGKLIAAAQEERFTRIKHDKNFPDNAINYCLEEARININDLEAIVYYDYETWTLERVIHNVDYIGGKGEELWETAQKSLFQKLKLPEIIRWRLGFEGKIFKTEHHISHAAGAYYPSNFNDAAILVIDGVGEWACTTIAQASDNKITILKQQYFPHSLGLLYSAFTNFCGFKVNSGEYKLMGLAPYGKPIYLDIIKEHLLDIFDDGSIQLNLEYFSFLSGDSMTNDKFASLFNGPARKRESDISRREMDLAASIQALTEEIVIKMANHAHSLTNSTNLVMSGGVALNCVSNGKLFDSTPFKDFHFQPASGDAGGAEGCVLKWYYENFEKTKVKNENAYLGPSFSNEEVIAFLETKGVPYHSMNENDRASTIAEILHKKNIVGHFDGRMEFGPRALGNRSIIADATDVDMQSKLNLKIKFRESFRPFAPIYAEERTSDYFDFQKPSPYMLIVRQVKKELLLTPELDQSASDNMIEIVNQKRSTLPSITHVDNSARLQSVNQNQNKRFHDLLLEFEKLSGKAILINTSFNVRGEPIVGNLEDAYRCFMRTNMDVLVLNDHYLVKSEQPKWEEIENWLETFELD
jgi:carbamoyltransferase